MSSKHVTVRPTRFVEKTSQLVLYVSLPLFQILLLSSAEGDITTLMSSNLPLCILPL